MSRGYERRRSGLERLLEVCVPCASMQKRTARGVVGGVLTSDVQFLPLRRCGTIHYFCAAVPITINIAPTNTAIATPEYSMP